MPYWLEDDTFHDDPRWSAMAGGKAALVDQLQAAKVRLMSYAGRHGSGGWITAANAAELARPRVLHLLTTRALPDQPPMVHTKGDPCDCYGDLWQDGYDYVIHRFLKRNPVKRETERHKAQKAEREDKAIRARVYTRDAGCCRYCRSGPMKKSGMGRSLDRRRILHIDHVDPDRLAGPDLENLVVSCGRCNQEKGNRTPDEADMVLLPVPSDAERAAWLVRPEHRLNPPARHKASQTLVDSRSDRPPDTPGTDPQTDSGPPVGQPVPQPVGTSVSGPVATGGVSPDSGADQHRHTPRTASEVAGSGRGGRPVPVADPYPYQPARGPDAPDIYHRRARLPPTHAPPQDQPGSTTTDQPSQGERS